MADICVTTLLSVVQQCKSMNDSQYIYKRLQNVLIKYCIPSFSLHITLTSDKLGINNFLPDDVTRSNKKPWK